MYTHKHTYAYLVQNLGDYNYFSLYLILLYKINTCCNVINIFYSGLLVMNSELFSYSS